EFQDNFWENYLNGVPLVCSSNGIKWTTLIAVRTRDRNIAVIRHSAHSKTNNSRLLKLLELVVASPQRHVHWSGIFPVLLAKQTPEFDCWLLLRSPLPMLRLTFCWFLCRATEMSLQCPDDLIPDVYQRSGKPELPCEAICCTDLETRTCD